MNSLEFIKQHVTELPDGCTGIRLDRDGEICFTGNCDASHDLHPDDFAPSYYDGKVWTREEFEECGKSSVSNNKYERELTDRQGNSATVDVYDVLQAFNVTCPATQHAVKKLLCTGVRGHKDGGTDLLEAREAITRAIELRG